MNKKPMAVTFDPALAPVLHTLVSGSDHPLFPFPAKGVSGENFRSELVKAGFLDKKGALLPDAERLLGSLTETRHSARLRVMTDGELIEFHVFLSGKNQTQTTALRPEGEKLVLESPAPVDDIIASLEELLGNSSVAASPTLGELGKTESLVLAAAIDLTRRELLTCLGQEKSWQPKPFTAETLESPLGPRNLNSFWLLWLVRHLGPDSGSTSVLEIEEALESLAGRNLLEESGKGYVVRREALVLASRFLQLPTMVRVDVAAMSGSVPVRSAFGAVQGGVRDILMIEPAGESCNWAGLSPRVLIGLIRRFLTRPAVIAPAPPSGHPSKLSSGRPTGDSCVSCGKTIEAKDPFCKFCGTPQVMEEKPEGRFCSKCGAPMKAGKKFCPKCGVPAK